MAQQGRKEVIDDDMEEKRKKVGELLGGFLDGIGIGIRSRPEAVR